MHSSSPSSATTSPRRHQRHLFIVESRSVEVRVCTSTSPVHKARAEEGAPWPPHTVKNKYIQKGYSIHEDYHHKLCDLHNIDNESMNILSAVVGYVPSAILVLNLMCLPMINGFNPKGLYIAIALFGLNAILVTGYHMFLSIPHLYSVWSAGDLIGINLGILSLASALLYYGYQLTNLSWGSEFALVAVAILITSALCATYRVMNGRDGLLWLQAANIACVVIFVLPTHILLTPATPRGNMFFFLLVLGALIHVLKVPERFFKDKFDLFGHSHMWWHLAYSFAYYAFFTNMFVLQTNRVDLLWDHAIFGKF